MSMLWHLVSHKNSLNYVTGTRAVMHCDIWIYANMNNSILVLHFFIIHLIFSALLQQVRIDDATTINN